jgi:hypothetical protein
MDDRPVRPNGNGMTMKIHTFARRFGIVAFALGDTLPSAHNVVQADDGVRTVALSTRPAPGTPAGVLYAGFDLSVLNDFGHAAFAASLSGAGVENTNANGVFSEGAGHLAMVARAGSPAPGTAALNFRGVGGRLGLSNTGRHAFEAALAGVTQDNEQGIWSDGTGTLALVARQGNPAVGTPAGVYYSHLNPGQTLVSNRAGRTAFTADLNYGNGLPWGSGLWAGGAGNLRAVALSGSHATGTPSGSVFATFGGYEGIALNDAGRTAFLAALEPGVNGIVHRVNSTGVWSEGSTGTLALVARAGSQAPGNPGRRNVRTRVLPAGVQQRRLGRVRGRPCRDWREQRERYGALVNDPNGVAAGRPRREPSPRYALRRELRELLWRVSCA